MTVDWSTILKIKVPKVPFGGITDTLIFLSKKSGRKCAGMEDTMIHPNNQRVMKIMELLEQTNLFSSDDLTKIEDYLTEDGDEREVEQLGLQNLEFQDLSERLDGVKTKFTSLFSELAQKGRYKEGEKLAKILFAIGQSTSRVLFPNQLLSSDFLSLEPAKKAALYASLAGHTESMLRKDSISGLLNITNRSLDDMAQALEYQKEEEGNGRLMLLTAYFFTKYPEAKPDEVTEIEPQDAEKMELYEAILKNSLEDFKFKNATWQELKEIADETGNVDERISGLKVKGNCVEPFVLRIVGGTAFINFSLSTCLKNIVKICLAANSSLMLEAMERMDNRSYIKGYGDKLDEFFGIDAKTYIGWAVKKDKKNVLKEQFARNRKAFMQYKEKAGFDIRSKMNAVIKELDPELYEEECSKEIGKHQQKVIDCFIAFADSSCSNEVRAYLNGETKIDSLYPVEETLSKGWRWAYLPWNELKSYQKSYGNDAISNRCEALLILCRGLSNYYYLDEVSKTGAEGVQRLFALMESEGMTLRHQLAAYSDVETSSYYSAEQWRGVFGEETEKVFQKHLEERREETLAVFREADSVGRCFALKMLAKEPQKNKAEIFGFTQDTSKTVKEELLSILYEAKDWKEDIIALLSSKKAADRDVAVRVFAKWGDEEYQSLISSALEKEKNMKVRALMESALNISGSAESGERSISQADFVKEIHKGNRKRALAWAYETPFSKVHKKNGEEADEDYMQALLLCYSTMDSYGVSPNAAMLAEALNANELAVFANELFDKWMDAGAESKKRWVLYASSIHGGSDIIKKLQHQLQEWPQAARGAIAAEAVQALALNPLPQALLIVDGISRKFKFKQVKAAAEKALGFAASQLGITREELADRIVPDLGFDETMKRVFDYGNRSFTVTITPSLEIEVFDESGKKLKNLPAPGKRDDEAKATAASEEFKQMKKQMKATVSSQKMRLEMALSTERQWSVEAWKNLFVKNPIMHQFAIGLIWGVYEDKKLTASFRYMEDGSFNTEDEDEFELPEEGQNTQFIGLVHPIELSEESLKTWKQQLEDYEITQPMEQLNRPVYYRTKEEENQSRLERFGGCIINDLSLGGKLIGAGWYHGPVLDGGGIYVYYREDPELELGVELNFSGGFVGGTNDDVTIYDARFYKAGSVKRGSYEYDEVNDEKAYLLKDVPERYFSEIVLQISKALASSKGRDENWKNKK